MLIELLRHGAEQAPAQPLVVSSAGTLSYGEALQRAQTLGHGLLASGITRFAALLDDVRDLLPLLCGASAAGAEACPMRPSLEDQEADSLLEHFEQPVVVADRPRRLERARTASLASLESAGGAGSLSPPQASPVLILTTGTTGRPKGARHDWSRLVAGTRHAAPAPQARWLLAYNLYQFAGIQMLLHVLATRGTLIAPESGQPKDAVAAMRRHGVTHVSATPTFWRFALTLLDASSASEIPLEQVTLGGEAVPAPVLDAIRRLFPDARVSQIYAATEFGSAVSVRDGRAGLPLSVLDRPEDADVRFRIVDGELQAASKVGMLGYYGEPDPPGGWRPTGDLVEVQGDRIVFVGRKSDVINVGGVKVHPLPVEEIVSGLPGVEMARAYGRANPMTGQILAVDVVPRPGVDTKELDREIRQACSSLGPAAQPRRIRFVDEIEVKGSKIARATA